MTYNMSLPFQFQSFVYFMILGESLLTFNLIKFKAALAQAQPSTYVQS